MAIDVIARGMAGSAQKSVNNAIGKIEQIPAVFSYKGSVADYASLPDSGVTLGDAYTTDDNGDVYVASSVSPLTWLKLNIGLSLYFG